jgi:hypothetical protein
MAGLFGAAYGIQNATDNMAASDGMSESGIIKTWKYVVGKTELFGVS